MLIPVPARTIALWTAFFSFTLSLISCGGTNSHQHFSELATPEPESIAGHHIKNVFLIAMENHNWTGDGSLNIKGNFDAPYINKTLVPMGAHPSGYKNPPGLHPSLPNYLWLEAGSNFGLRYESTVWAHSLSTTFHLVTQLKNAGISWRSYDEVTSGKDCPLGQWHTPMVFFKDVTNNDNWHSSYCISHTRPMSELWTDLRNGTTAHYSFIKPNLCHSMHSPCNGQNQIKQGDVWLSEHLPQILNSSAYKNGGVIFVVFDEANVGDGPIPVLILSPYAKRGYTNSTYYNHGSMLKTIQEIFGVGPPLRDAAKEGDLREFFTQFP
jgi:phosphatidylinositol-3-phosphatase